MAVELNVKNLDVSPAEYQTKYSVNRILQKLLENDHLLEELYQEVFGGFQIDEYEVGEEYLYNDVVWFLDSERDLHILRCSRSKTSANLTSWKSGESFEKYGWQDLNPDVDIMTEFGLQAKISSFIAKKFKQHSSDLSRHPYGKISYGGTKGSTDISRKVAKADMSNLDPQRSNNFFPYKTIYLKTDDTSPITFGVCRHYDNGLLEYDLTFRLGYGGIETVDEDYGIQAKIINANTLDLTAQKTDVKSFYSSGDTSIFSQTSSQTSEIGDTEQRNRNDFVNAYSAKLDFADAASGMTASTVKFKDSDSYMVFSGDMTCQTRDSLDAADAMCIGSNSIVFCRKEAGSITALLVTYPGLANASKDGYNAANGGLESISFTCKLVGRWK